MDKYNTDLLKELIENTLKENLYKSVPLKEARHLTNHSITRLSDGMKGIVRKSRVYGNAYDIEWEDGTSQTLGRNTITNQKKFILEKLEVSDDITDMNDKDSDFVWDEMKDPMLSTGKKLK